MTQYELGPFFNILGPNINPIRVWPIWPRWRDLSITYDLPVWYSRQQQQQSQNWNSKNYNNKNNIEQTKRVNKKNRNRKSKHWCRWKERWFQKTEQKLSRRFANPSILSLPPTRSRWVKLFTNPLIRPCRRSRSLLGEPSNEFFGKTWDFVPTRSPPPPLTERWDTQN